VEREFGVGGLGKNNDMKGANATMARELFAATGPTSSLKHMFHSFAHSIAERIGAWAFLVALLYS
jgi:hypothetical protein